MRAFKPREAHPVLHGVSAERIAEWCGVHVTTVRRWKRGEEPPKTALIVIKLMTGGSLGCLAAGWSGWSFRDGKLVSQSGESFSPGEVQAIPYNKRLIVHYQTEQKFAAQADWVSEQWTPAPEYEEQRAAG